MNRLILFGLWLASLAALAFALLMSFLQLLAGSRRAVRVFVGADQTLNAAIGGSEDETISSRAGKGARRGIWRYCLLCRVLDIVDPGHCEKSIEPDEGKPTPVARRGFSFKGEVMARIKTGFWLAVGVFVAGVVAAMTFRTAAAALAASFLAGVSGLAVASGVGGAGKAGAVAGAGVHIPAFVGALVGAALQWRQSAGRRRSERLLLAGVSLVAAYFGGLLTASLWPDLGGGAVGLGGLIAANLAVPLIDALGVLLVALRDALLALLRDVPWIKRLVGARLGLSTEPVDNPVDSKAGG